MDDLEATDAGLDELSLGHRAEIERVAGALFGDEAPVSVGRFELVRTLGRGAFGTVYEARDPQLERRVALKVLAADDPDAQAKLLREAKMMATVAHPNVATVYEVGTFELKERARVFVAMEFVDGVTLRERLQDGGKVMPLLIAAGRGLAAAHAAGVIHRDFKPDNVLVGRDGGVRVVDFGLASSAPEEAAGELDAASPTGTVTRGHAGTPAYMAPEVFDKQPADAASDQFSFCVTLYEAVFGQRPFAGGTVMELAANVARGDVRQPDRRVPPRLRRAIFRGLSVDPKARFPSIEALLAELGARPWYARRDVIVGAVAAVAAGTAGAVLSRGGLTVAPPCLIDLAAVERVWTGARSVAASQAFATAAPAYGADTWQRTRVRIDAYAERWGEAAAAHCERPSETTTRELEAACLERARGRLDGLVADFEDASATTVGGSVAAVLRLPDLSRCLDGKRLLALTPEEPADRAKADAIRDALATIATEIVGGRYDAAREGLEQVTADAASLGFAPVTADVASSRAYFDLKTGDFEGSRARAREAFDAALLGDDERAAVSAALLLAQAGVADRHLVDEGLSWIKTAQSLLARAGDDPELEGHIALARASLLIGKGEREQAMDAVTAAVALLEANDPDDPRLVAAMGNWGTLLLQLGRPQEAAQRYAKAVETAERNLGSSHPDVAKWLQGLGSASMTTGDFEAAGDALRRSLRIALDSVGESHPNAIQTRMYLGVLGHNTERFDEALEHYATALANAREHLGAEHPLVAEICLRYADTLSLAGKHAEAKPIVETARTIYEGMLPADDPGLAPVFTTSLIAAARAGRLEDAVVAGRRGLEVSAAVGDSHPTTVNLLHETARALINLGRMTDAIELLTRAASSLATDVEDPRRRALVEFELAMALWPRDRAAARKHAQTAQTVQPVNVTGEEREQITRWLAEHE